MFCVTLCLYIVFFFKESLYSFVRQYLYYFVINTHNYLKYKYYLIIFFFLFFEDDEFREP